MEHFIRLRDYNKKKNINVREAGCPLKVYSAILQLVFLLGMTSMHTCRHGNIATIKSDGGKKHTATDMHTDKL